MIEILKFNFKKILKWKIFWVGIFIMCAFVILETMTLLQSPYDTIQHYNEGLGYISYAQVQKMSEKDFLDYMNSKENKFCIYDFYGNYEQRAEINRIKKIKKNFYEDERFLNYANQGIVKNIRIVNFNQIKSMSENDYEQVKDSLYVPFASRPMLYFNNMLYNEYNDNKPLWNEIRTLEKKDSIGNLISREILCRSEYVISLLLMVLTIWIITEEYKNKSMQHINASNMGFSFIFITKLFVLYILPVLIIGAVFCLTAFMKIKALVVHEWDYNICNFIRNYILFILPTAAFIVALSGLISVTIKNRISSIACGFFYIFLLSEGKLTENGFYHWSIYWYKYFPRVDMQLNIMEKMGGQVLEHQILYLGITFVICLLIALKLKYDRIKGSDI